jgi:hypothetical protein
MPYARFDNFGRGGFNPDSYETGLAPGQWSEMYNADIYNGDIYACGEEPVRFDGCPFQIRYSYIYLTDDRAIYVASDGSTLAAYVNGEWRVLREGLGGGIVTFDTFLGTLIINSLTGGAFYWRGLTGVPGLSQWFEADQSWSSAQSVQWNSRTDKTVALTAWGKSGGYTWAGASGFQWNNLQEEVCPPLPGWPYRAKCLQIVAFGNRLVALSVDYSPAVIGTTWASSDVETWADGDSQTWQDLLASGKNALDGESRAPYLVWWSSAAPAGAVPSEWLPSTRNTAGDVLLQDTGGPITGGKKLRDSLIVYKSDSIYRLFETFSTDAVLAYERVLSRPSIESPYGVAEYGEAHYCISKTGIFVFNGQQAQQIDFDRVHGAVLSVSLLRGFDQVQVVANETDAEVWFGFRNIGAGPLTTVLKYSIPYNAFCVHSYGDGLTAMTAGQYDEEFVGRAWSDPPVARWEDGLGTPWSGSELRGNLIDRVFLANNNEVRTYEPLRGGRLGKSARTTELVRYGVRLADPSQKTMLRALYPEMEGGEAVTFQVGIQHQPWLSLDGQLPQIVWGPEREFRPGTDIELPLCDVGSVYAIRVKSRTDSQADNPFWRIHALGFHFDVLGQYG